MWKYAFWQFSKKLVDDKKYLIVTLHKSFGERFDHFHQSENILQSYSHHQKNIFKMKFRSYFHFGFMNFFWILLSKKSLKCVVPCIRYFTLHRINEFWWVRTHTWKNSSIFLMLKLSNFTKSDIFTMCLNDSMEEFFVRTHTWKIFRWILWIM